MSETGLKERGAEVVEEGQLPPVPDISTLPAVSRLGKAGELGHGVRILASKFYLLASSMSIRYKIAAALVVVLCLSIASLGIITFNMQKKILRGEMAKRAEVIVQNIANSGKPALLTHNELQGYSAIKDLEKSGGVVYAMILDSKGSVFAHSRLGETGKKLSGPADKAALASAGLLFQEAEVNGVPVLEASIPITARLDEKTLRIGTARAGLSLKELHGAISRGKLVFAGITVIFVLLGLVISFALGKLLTRQILVLAAGMDVVSKGDLSRHVKVEAYDEIGRLSESFNHMVEKLQEKLKMEKYLSQSTLQLISRRGGVDEFKLGGERRHVTVLFSDVRGFTSMSEKLDPEEVVGLLNIYLNLQAEVVYQFGGSVNKFVGDEVMAIFTDKDSELQAARSASEMQRFIKVLNKARAALGKRQINVGIGVNAGEVILGNMGSERQMDYTVIGDPINVAARLCGAAAPGQIIVSRAVASALGKEAKFKKLGPMQLKGKEDSVEILELQEISGATRASMRRQANIAVSYSLSGLSEEKTPAVILDMGQGGCVLRSSTPTGVGGLLEIEMEMSALPRPTRIKGVVCHVKKSEGNYLLGVTFQNLPEDLCNSLTEWVHHIDPRGA